ncbi:hypothetical protein HNQ63_003081 [Wenzhouxiangella marina]|uniref:Uncharacterized protein n=1 Tax=Wenzhouxiangella marina TaxID=1579979 RepID=A0A0K0XYL5_9GAMM|nr:hypothetical protein WM2015_2354 [Wenzhouxiangella marina]MBB6088594.1 hypothetical protein [Wenzhouxiangella marina]
MDRLRFPSIVAGCQRSISTAPRTTRGPGPVKHRLRQSEPWVGRGHVPDGPYIRNLRQSDCEMTEPHRQSDAHIPTHPPGTERSHHETITIVRRCMSRGQRCLRYPCVGFSAMLGALRRRVDGDVGYMDRRARGPDLRSASIVAGVPSMSINGTPKPSPRWTGACRLAGDAGDIRASGFPRWLRHCAVGLTEMSGTWTVGDVAPTYPGPRLTEPMFDGPGASGGPGCR